jgi:hypothetical protein
MTWLRGSMESVQSSNDLPGDPEDFFRTVGVAESYYWRSLEHMVVYWDVNVKRFRLSYLAEFEADANKIEIVTIP